MKRGLPYLLLSANVLSAQKKLSQLDVTLASTEFEEVSPSSLPAFIEEQKQKGANFERYFNIVTTRHRETTNIYRLKETGELITVNSRLYKGYKKNWDKEVATNIATYASGYGRERYVEHLKGKPTVPLYFSRKGIHRL